MLADPTIIRDQRLPIFRKNIHNYINLLSENQARVGIVARTSSLMAAVCAQKFRLPYINAYLQPSAVPDPLERGVFRRSLQSLEFQHCRIAAGLPPALDIQPILAGAAATLSLFPSWFGGASPAKWTSGHMVGFPFIDAEDQPDACLDAFLARHGPPIIFAPGTGLRKIEGIAAMARKTCDILGMPGVFTSSYLAQGADEVSDERFLIRNHIDFSRVLPRAAILVHHGGIGTLAQAIRAGVPQLVRPQHYDQPDNAARLVAMNLAHLIEPTEDDPHVMAAAIRAVLDDKKLRCTATELATRTRSENGAASAADVIEASLQAR